MLEQKKHLDIILLNNKSDITGFTNNSYFYENVWFGESTENITILIS